ncbi:hypothetical protein J7E79_07245 [Bacillus sp. ISL-40]|uniref:hypothetical protein n=1 Tax=unclassified Bacillus (in: firmicutes) TaxID=185979 RepID=UPI001BE4E8BC|nr:MULTISPECIES: hypothetical protein [unclassified Bacillus (in: firmicutes)]MBT2697205.1 hypothetical protein [Bacillus sp. ISL-40]MBT2720047.1 hypothetical protein [Bacillus sp. ISL-46]MBT2740203.1 hypothetical protein [Bacillus sp. ISL-77]
MIKNISLITDNIKDFSLQNIEFIVGFLLNFQNRSFEDNCVLDIDFIIKDKEKQYIACFRFYNPKSINFESGGIYHQMSIEIYDIRDRGWGNKKYEVIDYEDDTLHFYCSDIEIISLRELNK